MTYQIQQQQPSGRWATVRQCAQLPTALDAMEYYVRFFNEQYRLVDEDGHVMTTRTGIGFDSIDFQRWQNERAILGLR